MWNIDLYAPNYNGYVATITYYPSTGGTFNLGSFLMSPCTVSVDYPYGDFYLFFSAFNSTCIVSTSPEITPTPTSTIGITPTPTTTTTLTPSPTSTLGTTPTPTTTTTLTATPSSTPPSETPTMTPTPTTTTTLTATPSSTPPALTPTTTPTSTNTPTPSTTPPSVSPTTTSTPTNTPSETPPTYVCYYFQNEDSVQSTIYYYWIFGGSTSEVLNAGEARQRCVDPNQFAPYYTGGVTTIGACSSATICTDDGTCEGCT